jgi:tetratricopeptide (TPR) repeat protein
MLNQANEKNTKKAKDDRKWSRARTKNGKSRNGSKGNYFAEIEALIARRQWTRARHLIQEGLVFHPTDHWLWLNLGLTYYEQKSYEKALKCSEYAVQLQPDCPLALWHYAGTLAMTGNENSALAIWTTLLNRDLEDIADGDHGEGMDWALQLVNDVHFRMGRCYQWLGHKDLARQSFQKYLHNRQHGVSSIYDVKTAEKNLAELTAA